METIFDAIAGMTINRLGNSSKIRQWMTKIKLFKHIVNCIILMINHLQKSEQTDDNQKLHNELIESLNMIRVVSNCKMVTCEYCVSEDDICQTCTSTNDSYQEKIVNRFYNKLVNGIIMGSSIVQRNAIAFELINSTTLTIQNEIDHVGNSQSLDVLLLKFKKQMLTLAIFISGEDTEEKISIYSNYVMSECKLAVQEYIQLGETHSEDLRAKLTTVLNM